jgi:hypothetical protein
VQPELRARFNADFTPEKYAALLRCVNETEKWPADFRVSETPIFLTREFHDELVAAAKEIVGKTRTPEFARHAATAIPPGLEVPNETTHPAFLVVDFGSLHRGESARPSPDRVTGLSQPLWISIARAWLHAQSVPHHPAPLDVGVRRNAG